MTSLKDEKKSTECSLTVECSAPFLTDSAHPDAESESKAEWDEQQQMEEADVRARASSLSSLDSDTEPEDFGIYFQHYRSLPRWLRYKTILEFALQPKAATTPLSLDMLKLRHLFVTMADVQELSDLLRITESSGMLQTAGFSVSFKHASAAEYARHESGLNFDHRRALKLRGCFHLLSVQSHCEENQALLREKIKAVLHLSPHAEIPEFKTFRNFWRKEVLKSAAQLVACLRSCAPDTINAHGSRISVLLAVF